MTAWGPERIQSEVDRIKLATRNGKTFRVLNQYLSFIVSDKTWCDECRRENGHSRSKDETEGNRNLLKSMVEALRAKNFWVARDREVKRQFHCLTHDRWMGAHWGSKLRFRAECYPTGLKIEFYPDCNPSHGSGPKYAFDKRTAIDFWSRMALKLAIRELSKIAEQAGLTNITDPTFENPRDKLEWSCRDSWHFKGEASIDVPRKTEDYNDTNLNKRRLKNGDIQGYRDSKGRLWVGKVYVGLNNTWRMIAGGTVIHTHTGELFDFRTGLERKQPTSSTISSAKRHLKRAIENEDFERCAAIRDHLKTMRATAEATP